MARAPSNNSSNPLFNPGNTQCKRYRIRCVHDYRFFEGVYDTIQQLLDDVNESCPELNLTRGKVLRIRNHTMRKCNKYSNVEIVELTPMDVTV